LILDETIWSLTSPRAKRISGSENFRSPPQKLFSTLSAQTGPLEVSRTATGSWSVLALAPELISSSAIAMDDPALVTRASLAASARHRAASA
jgi:hypothetical protein